MSEFEGFLRIPRVITVRGNSFCSVTIPKSHYSFLPSLFVSFGLILIVRVIDTFGCLTTNSGLLDIPRSAFSIPGFDDPLRAHHFTPMTMTMNVTVKPFIIVRLKSDEVSGQRVCL
jgi:hypothetical protein